ncbi:MAG TPA: restriction endonuclease, partial [Blastocatellia bacterium]|nr:restriction endonuclease [Blastocatellia bacterium]
LLVHGDPGVGKTSLVRQFVDSYFRGEARWINMAELLSSEKNRGDQSVGASVRTMLVANDNPIVVLDDLEGLDARLINDYLGRILNFKRVRSVIVIARSPLRLRAVGRLELSRLTIPETVDLLNRMIGARIPDSDLAKLAPALHGSPLAVKLLAEFLKDHPISAASSFVDGELYSLDKASGATADEIVRIAQPQVIQVTDAIITDLKSRPQDVYNLTPRQFEEVIARLLEDRGFTVEVTQRTRDGGKDILAYLDTVVGRMLCLVEAKRYGRGKSVGVELVRNLYGTLCDYRASSAMLVTTSRFSTDAKVFQNRHPYELSLRDYADLVEWINRYKGDPQ